MKYITAFATTFVLALGLFFAFPGGTAFANRPPLEASDTPSKAICFADWNGESFQLNSNKDKNYKSSGCAKVSGGTCKATNTKKNGKTIKKIACQKPAAADDPASDDLGGDAESIKDPALTCNQDGGCDIIDNYVNPTIRVLTILVGIAVAIGIIWGAIQVSMSAGDPQKSANGKNHIRNALIALVAYILLYAFLQWVVPGGVV